MAHLTKKLKSPKKGKKIQHPNLGKRKNAG